MTSYDEDILDNPFYQALLEKFSDLYDVATSNGWMVCIPRLGSAARLQLTRRDFENHLLVPASSDEEEDSQKRSFVTPNAKKLEIEGDVIITGSGYESSRSVRILFQETNYGHRESKYIVLCIDQPLEGDLVEEMKVATLLSAEDCSKFLFADSGPRIQKQVDKLLKLVVSSMNMLEGDSLRNIVDAVGATTTRAMQTILKDSSVRKLSRQNQAYMENVKLSVATYVMESLHQSVFPACCALAAKGDAALNKMTRKLSETRPEDLGLTPNHCTSLPKARRELSTLNRYTTPLDKLLCLRRVIYALTTTTAGQEGITADDLLPLLIFFLIRSDIANWMGNMLYITQFLPNSSTGEFVFVMSSFEAAVQHVKDDHVNSDELIKTSLSSSYLRSKSSDSCATDSSVDKFFEHVRQNDLETVNRLLTAKLELSNAMLEKMCHPLCSCERCERLAFGGKVKETDDNMAVAANSRDDLGRTALHIAAQHGHSQMVQLLLDCGAVATSTDYHTSTALHLACRRGHIAVATVLSRLVDVNSQDNDGNAGLHLTAANGHEEVLRALFALRSDVDVDLQNERGDTCLHLAARWGYESIVKLLLDKKALPNLANRHKETPRQCTHNQRIIGLLTSDIERRATEESYLLIKDPVSSGEASADSGSTVAEERTQPMASDGKLQRKSSSQASADPLSVAAQQYASSQECSDSPDAARSSPALRPTSVKEKGRKTSKGTVVKPTSREAVSSGPLTGTMSQLSKEIDHLLKLCADGDVHMVRYKLGFSDEETSPRAVVYQESDLCHPLCECSSCEAIRQRGSAPTLTSESCNQDGMAPLHVASLHGRRHVVQLLLRHGAVVNCKNNAKQTPLHLACQYNHQDIVQLLVDYHAKVSPPDINGRTPLHACCANGHNASAVILLFHGADVNAADKRGSTPLHQASRWGHATLANTLLLHGASPSIANASDLQPIQVTQDDEVRSLLQSAMKGKISIGSHRLRATTSAGQSVGSDRRGRGNSSPVPVTLDTEINQSSVSSSDQSSGRAPSPRGNTNDTRDVDVTEKPADTASGTQAQTVGASVSITTSSQTTTSAHTSAASGNALSAGVVSAPSTAAVLDKDSSKPELSSSSTADSDAVPTTLVEDPCHSPSVPAEDMLNVSKPDMSSSVTADSDTAATTHPGDLSAEDETDAAGQSPASSLDSSIISPSRARPRPASMQRLEELLTAIEDRSFDKLRTLAALTSDVQTFNRRTSLRHSLTNDKSGPSTTAKHQFSIMHFQTSKLRQVETRDYSRPNLEMTEEYDSLTHDKSVEETQAEPVEGKQDEPVEAKQGELVEGNLAEPVEDKVAEPMEDKESELVEGKVAEPVQDKQAEPMEDNQTN